MANLRATGLRQQDIAARLGVSERAVSAWSTGDRAPTHYRTVLEALNLHLDRCPERHRVEVIGSP